MSNQPTQPTDQQFFSNSNEVMLGRLLTSDFKRRIGTDLNDKQQERLQKTVRHYMREVYSKNPKEPVQYLNKEVLTAVVPDYMSYIRRSSISTQGASGLIANSPDPLTQDVNSRFDRLTNERQEGRALAPPQPDFRISLDAEGPSSVALFEQVKLQREAEAKRVAELAASMLSGAGGSSSGTELSALNDSPDPSLKRLVDADTDFKSQFDANKARDENALVVRNAERALANRSAAAAAPMRELPDPRRILFGDGALQTIGRTAAAAAGSPTYALAEGIRARGALPQDNLRPNDEVVSYRENEYNLFVYSADRDWVNNNNENRYNFSVNFDPANNRPGFGFSPATNIKFKNISRIEFVKAIVPTEACDILPAYTGASPAYSTALSANILSYPYLQVRIPELNTNGYGTNDGLNNAFAVISYEAYWTADSAAANRGYSRMIPKFLKCQKVFYPTPLATLQKLTFEIQRPDGSLVCESKDTLDVSAVLMPINTASTTNYKGSGAATFEWIWINTKTWFNRFAFTQGDRVVFKNITLNATLAANANATSLVAFLQRPEGHLVCDIGRSTGASSGYLDGVNTAGYANSIIIRNDFNDPTTGSTSVKSWVASIGSSVNSNSAVTTGRFINMNHQVQLILRVITRDMDAITRLRPDNLEG